MIFGADKIPEIARGMGKGIRQVRDATQEIKSEIKKGSKNKGIETDNIKDDISKVKRLYREVPFFRALVSNSMMSLTKSFFKLTAYMKDDQEFGDFWKIIFEEYQLTKKMLLKVSSFKTLMENEPANKLSIQTRENIVLPLITIQQYSLQKIQKIISSVESKDLKTYQKIVTRTLFGNINASRNSA